VLNLAATCRAMGGLFSKKKRPKVNQHDKAVLDLKVQRDKLTTYQKKCALVINKEMELARVLLKEGKKKQAILALKKKKYQEQLLTKSENQLSTLQEMIDSVEFSQMEQKVFESLKAGNEVLKEIHSQMSIDEIDQLMEDTQEAVAYQKEIEEALAGQLTSEDEDDVLAELEELERATLEMPSIPKEVLPESGEPVRAVKSTPHKKKEAEMVAV